MRWFILFALQMLSMAVVHGEVFFPTHTHKMMHDFLCAMSLKSNKGTKTSYFKNKIVKTQCVVKNNIRQVIFLIFNELTF